MHDHNKNKRLSSSTIVLIYALFAAIWIAASDKLLALIISDHEMMTVLSIGKGFLFVAITSLALYLLLNLYEKRSNLPAPNLSNEKNASRRLALLFVSQIILMPLIPAVLYEWQGQQVKKTTKNDLTAFSKVKKERIQNWLNERYSDAIMLQHNASFLQAVSLINLGGSIHSSPIDLPIQLLLNNKSYQAASILNKAGDLVGIFGHLPVHRFLMPETKIKSPLLQNAHLQSDITTQWYWNENKELYLDIKVPLHDPRTQDFIGTLVLTQNLLTQLLPHIQNWPSNTETGVIYLLQVHNDRLSFIKVPANDGIHATNVERFLNTDMSELVNRIITNKDGFYEGLDFNNQDIFASYESIDNSGWYILVQQEQSELFAPLYTLIKLVVLIVFFGGLMMLFLINLLWRQQLYSNRLELQHQTDEKDRLLRYFFELPLFGMAITHAGNGRWIRFNEQLAQMLGYSSDELINIDLRALTPESDRIADQRELEQLENGQSNGFQREKQLRHKNGHFIDVYVDTRCVRTPDKKVAFIISVIEDISTRKANEVLLERQRNLYDMLSLTNQAIIRFKHKDTLLRHICQIAVEHGKFLFAWFGAYDEENEHIKIIHTFGRDNGFTDWIISENEKQPDLIRNTPAMHALKSGENLIVNNIQQQATISRLHLKAQEAGIASSAYFIIREQGKIIGSFNVYASSDNFFIPEITNTLSDMANDISFALDNLRKDRKLLQNEERFRAAIMNSPAPTVIYTQTGKGLTINKRWTELTGYTLEDLPNRSVWMEVAEPLDQNNPWLIQDHGPTIIEPVYAGEYRVHCKDGSVRYWDMLTSPLSVDDNGERLLVTMANDVTERRTAEEALKQSEKLFHTLATFVPVGIFRLNKETKPVYVNEAGENLLNWSIGIEDEWYSSLHHQDLVIFKQQWLQHLIAGHQVELPCRIQRDTDNVISYRWVVMSAKPERDEQQNITGYIGSITDISSQKENELILNQAATVFENTQEGILITDMQGKIVRANPATIRLFGYQPSELIDQPTTILQLPGEDLSLNETIVKALNTFGYWRGEVTCMKKDKTTVPLLASVNTVKDDQQNNINFVIVYSDISKLKETEQQLSFLAHHDSLTRLPNRAYLAIKLASAIEYAHLQNQKIALLILDLDRFKNVNDSFGHPIGDALLEEVANRFRSIQRESDSIFRLGGDEFTILMENTTDKTTINQYADDIINLLKAPFRLPNGKDVVIGTSIGISLYPENGTTPEELLQQADAAMYSAKSSGRSCYRYFSQDLTFAVTQRLDLEIRLRRAIENQEFLIYLQPQYDMASNRIIGAEALVRWHDPENGMIPPNLFIPTAEETGLIKQIGEWVLNETCKVGAKWLEEGLPPINLAVNVSSVQFQYSNILHVVEAALTETEFPATLLELEITESALMSYENEAETLLSELRKFGVRIAMDDFGTGYSSLAYLKRLPLDVLKIDKSFVDDIPDKLDDMEIAATIIGMAKTLGLSVLAEGVETQEQLDFLKFQGCDYYQGYLMHPPLPIEKFEMLLRQQPTKPQRFLKGEHYEEP